MENEQNEQFEIIYKKYFTKKKSPKIGIQHQVTRFPVLKTKENPWEYCPKKSELKTFKGLAVWNRFEFD